MDPHEFVELYRCLGNLQIIGRRARIIFPGATIVDWDAIKRDARVILLAICEACIKITNRIEASDAEETLRQVMIKNMQRTCMTADTCHGKLCGNGTRAENLASIEDAITSIKRMCEKTQPTKVN
jgi:hypothetical protein